MPPGNYQVLQNPGRGVPALWGGPQLPGGLSDRHPGQPCPELFANSVRPGRPTPPTCQFSETFDLTTGELAALDDCSPTPGRPGAGILDTLAEAGQGRRLHPGGPGGAVQ